MDIQLELTQNARSLGVSHVSCSEGRFVIVFHNKEYWYPFCSDTFDKNLEKTLAYLENCMLDGDGNSHEALPLNVTQSVLDVMKLAGNWNLVIQMVDTLCEETREIEHKAAIETIDKQYGFTTTPASDILTESNCEYPIDPEKQKELEELRLVKTPVTERDIKFVIETIYKEAEYDKPSINQLFLGMCSAFTKTSISHNVNSPVAGAGKNYLLKLVSSLFPRRYVEQLAGVSDKAFFHRRGRMVIKNELTGELEFVEPIIDSLEKEKSDTELLLEIESEKQPKDRDKELRKKNRSRIKEIDNEIRTIKKRWQKLIEIDNLIIILLDTPQEGFYTTLMSLISADTGEEQEYLFTDKTASGRNEATSNILRGQPAIITAQVVDDTNNKRFAEKNRRFVPITPNTSKEKINAAMRLMGKKAGLLPKEYAEQIVSEEDKERARKIVAAIVEKLKHHSKNLKLGEYGVKIPFLEALDNSIAAERDGEVWLMTVKKRILDYLAINTKLRIDSRPRLVDEQTGAFYPIATFEDLAKILEIMERGGTNIRAYLVDFYNNIILPAYKSLDGKVNEKKLEDTVIEKESHVGLTTEQIGNWMGEKQGPPVIGGKQLRDIYLYPLCNCGLLNYVKSGLNRGENIWFPVDPGTNAFSLFKDGDRKLTIRDPKVYPSPNVLEQSFSPIVKHATDQENGTGEKFYRLEDSNGIEISIDQMIQKYFSNPESCFNLVVEEK